MDKQLQEILSYFHQDELAYWLDSGTLLGLMREGQLLASDKDLDISIWDTELAQLQALLPSFRQAGYQIYAASYQGQIFKYNLTPSNLKKLRTVDINIYRSNNNHAWCPMYYFKLSPTTEKKPPSKASPLKALRSLLRSTWKAINTKFTMNVKIDRLPWQPFLIIGTWWIPQAFYDKRIFNEQYQVWIPAAWQDYLAFRYGNWQEPQTDWVFYRDDQGINPQSPQQLLNN
ncbi:MAG TPA: LicD family protein [Oscillospiraceae bacterium]|nr:LicD family protein [Oscillospiraceae bacterium]